MNKAQKVLITIAIAICLVQVAALLVSLIEPVSPRYASSFSNQALPRWLVYWIGGTIVLCLGIIGPRQKTPLLGDSLAIGGVYLMLLGNNGGLFSTGYTEHRLATSIVTLIVLAFLAVRLDKRKPEITATA